jgi:hypothetical protein
MAIGSSFIGAIGGYCYLFYWWLLMVILLVVIILMDIIGYYINGY